MAQQLKISLAGIDEIRKITSVSNFKVLKEKIKNVFRAELFGVQDNKLGLYYIDEDGERMSVDDINDLQEGIN